MKKTYKKNLIKILITIFLFISILNIVNAQLLECDCYNYGVTDPDRDCFDKYGNLDYQCDTYAAYNGECEDTQGTGYEGLCKSTGEVEKGIPYAKGNPSYDANAYDAFGLYYRKGSIIEHNAPTTLQSKFAQEGTDEADAWVLSKVEWPTGSITEWDYEVDDWYTARGDLEYPYDPPESSIIGGKNVHTGISGTNPIDYITNNGFHNYYACIRGYYKEYWEPYKSTPKPAELPQVGSSCKIPTSKEKVYKCENNYGGGIRVKEEKTCDLVNNKCSTTYYEYKKKSPQLNCDISTGSLTVVPVAIGKSDEDSDLRKPGHTGGKYTTGSVMYNYVKVSTDTSPGYVEYYYLTSDSMNVDEGRFSSYIIDTTDGSLPYGTRAEDNFSGKGRPSASDPYNLYGDRSETYEGSSPETGTSQGTSAGTVDKSWMRGQEYKIVYYDGNGKKLKEIQRYYQPTEQFKWYFGSEMVGKDFTYVYSDNNLYGFSAGWTNLEKLKTTYYDPNTGNKFSYITTNEFDENTGLPKKIEECISLDGVTCIDKKATTIDYAYKYYPNMKDKHMMLQPYKVSVSNKDNQVVSETITTYKEEA